MSSQLTTDAIIETLNYVKKFAGMTILIKLSGAALENKNLVKKLCEDISLIRAAGIKIVLVHGGGHSIDKALTMHKLSWCFYEGQRVTTTEMIDVIEMVLCGHVNRTIVRSLNTFGVSAVGLSGSDNHMLHCSRMSPQLGEVGQIDKIDVTMIQRCLNDQSQRLQGHIPVIAPIGVDKAGNALNVNADWAACQLAIALKVDKLVYLTDQIGIYNKTGKLFSTLSKKQLVALKENKTVTDGMLTKVNTILSALDCGIDNIHILNAKKPHVLIEELFTAQGIGTLCYQDIDKAA